MQLCFVALNHPLPSPLLARMKFTSLTLRVASIALVAGGMAMDNLAVDFNMVDDTGRVVSPDQCTLLSAYVAACDKKYFNAKSS